MHGVGGHLEWVECVNMNKQNSGGSGFADVPAPLDYLFLCKDSHWDANQHIQPLIYFIGTTSLLLIITVV